MRLLLAALLFISTQALAVPYKFESGSWKFLQNSNGQLVCTSTGPACDVPAGNYSLFDYVNYPPVRTEIAIAAESRGESIVVSEICDMAASWSGSTCRIECPVGMEVSKVLSCFAISRSSEIFVGTNFTSYAGTLSCNAAGFNDEIEMTAKIECE